MSMAVKGHQAANNDTPRHNSTVRGGSGVNVNVMQNSSALDAELHGHLPEVQVSTPHTSITAKGAFAILAILAVSILAALLAHLQTQEPGPSRRATMSESDVRVLAGEVANQTADRVEKLMDAKLGAVRVEVGALRDAVGRVEANQATVMRAHGGTR